MLHRTVWDAPSASSKRKLVLETGGGYVTPICMECAVPQFDKEVSFTLGKRVEMLHRTVSDLRSASSIRKLVFNQEQGRKYYIELYGMCRPPVRKGS